MYSPVSSDNTILQLVDPVDAGEFLDDLIQEDWEVFSDRLFVREREMDLLEAILNARYTEAEWRSREREESPMCRRAWHANQLHSRCQPAHRRVRNHYGRRYQFWDYDRGFKGCLKVIGPS